jgi:hypothetical protein
MRRSAAAALAAAALLPGCGGRPAAPPEPPARTEVSGYFVGRSDTGLGAAVDFSGFDDTSLALREALDPGARPDRRRLEIGIVSLVNSGDVPVALPAFRAVGRDGREVPLAPAGRALAGRRGAAAARARELLPRARAVPAQGTATLYVVLEGMRIADVAEVAMGFGPASTRLRPEER